MENYRHLTSEEISIMEASGCSATDWNDVTVKSPFDPNHYILVRFSGTVRLGTTQNMVRVRYGESPSGIYNAHIHNCTIGDDVRIVSVHDSVANYDIASNVLLCNVDSMTCCGDACFGNGVRVNVLDETGSRATPIFDCLSAQTAYIYAFYRHDPTLIERLDEIIGRYVASRHSSRGYVGSGSVVCDTASIRDVYIDSNVRILNAGSLTNGTICRGAIVCNGVIARNFIFQRQCRVDNASILENVYVGQSSIVSNGFSALHSLIFANCNMQRGEAVSVFAGPHTTSLHKSTLLIGGYFSFFEAGSGTNESNSHFRLGPVHYGIFNRGCRTGSNAYATWPAHFGQHSIITGSHYRHPDTTPFPFSHVMADPSGNTIVRPAVALRNVGLISDLYRWTTEDRRTGSNIDCINYGLFTPYYVGSMFKGIKELVRYEASPSDFAPMHISLRQDDISEGRKIYAFFIDYLIGQKVVQRFLDASIDPDKPIGNQLFPDDVDAKDAVEWVDIAGMLTLKSSLADMLLNPVKAGVIDSVDDLHVAFASLHDNFARYQSAFVRARFHECFTVDVEMLEPPMLKAIMDRWSETLSVLTKTRVNDSLKEFSADVMIVYGIDGHKEEDFMAVRGTPDTDPDVCVVTDHYSRSYDQYISAIKKYEQLYINR